MSTRDIVILLAFLAFGAINQWMRKKKAEAELRKQAPKPADPARPAARTAEARRPEAKPMVEKDADDWTGEWEDEEEEDWDEHHSSRDEHEREESRPEARTRESDTRRPRVPETPKQAHRPAPPAPVPPPRPAPERVQPPSGRDILKELAKQLGLEIPETQAPKPQPVPQPTRAPAPPTPAKGHAHPRPVHRHETEARPASAARLSASLPEPKRAAEPLPDLSSPEALRKAFVLKTLLDAPLSRQPRRRRPGP